MNADLIQILLIEDDLGDVLLLKESLAEATAIRIKLTHADRLSEGMKRIAEQVFDVILLDLNLPDSFGLDTLNNLQRQVPNIPVVVLSGLADDYITIEAVRHGAQDFLVKGEISGPMLGRVLRYAIERKQNVERLHESQERYRRIIETAQEGVWAIDADNHTTLVNQRLADMLGYTIEEIIGKTIYDFTDEEGIAIGVKSLENRRLGINEQFDFKFIRKDGAIVWAILETSPLYDQNGQYAGALAMLTDITQRKQTEAQLVEAHKFLENIMTHSPVGILTYKFTGECLSANEYAASIVGATIDQLHSQNFRALDSWKHSGLYDLAEKAMATRVEQKADIYNFTSFGKRIWFTAQFVVFQAGVEDCLLLTISDITEKKQAGEALELAYSQLANLYNNLPQAVFSIDVVQNKMLQASPAHQAVFGYPPDAFFENPQLWHEIIVPEDKPIVDANYSSLFAGQIVQHQFRIVRPDRQMRWLEAMIKPTLSEDGKPLRFDGIVSDITERKQTEEKIRRQLARLTALSEIDRAISSSFDLQFSLDAVLVHVIAQLGADAADVLLYDSAAQMLEYAAGQGFRSRAIEKASISLAEDMHLAQC